jgi:small subunit ribosomal protein S13
MYGLKVRGQRTRCTGRKGGAVGVAKGGKAAPVKSSGPEAVAAPTGDAAAATTTAATTTAATTTAATTTPAKKESTEKKE